ncbi:MAG: glycosyltransferase family 2 protein [Patescibacteria group bacterium]|nr:glycosyltransferase family 2 protein [Patescibacteria group bacterium]MCL5095184.1 glycosyltransferase family 2 protein [Patescibacteria group bacterium]
MKVSIIIPNYNRTDDLVKNLPLILETGASEVIVVDDGSEQFQSSILREFIQKQNYSSKVKIIENKKNLGFSSTINRGVKEAIGEIVVLLNTDVTPKADFLRPLVQHFTDLQVFAVGCLDISIEGEKEIQRGRGLAKWHHGFLIHKRGEVNKTETFWVSCGSGAFRKDLWEKLGGLDSLYNPFYWEDIDLSYRARKSGYKIIFEPLSQVIHRHEEGIIKQKFSQFYIKTISYRNQFIFIWKNITDYDLLRSHFLWLSYHLIRRIISLDLPFWLGFMMAIGKLPTILVHRLKTVKLFVKKDKELFLDD